MSRKVTFNPEEILLSANALFRTEQSKDLRGVIAEKIEDLQHYDVRTMERVVAICPWGRSGSYLLASYLDGHGDVVMLPSTRSQLIYKFVELYQSWPLRDKLLAYPAFTERWDIIGEENGLGRSFFDGDFAISLAQYYAAVQAILEVYGKWPPEFLASRRAFFLFVHIAYNLALGRRPASSRPLIVYAQHTHDNVLATQLVADFPQAKFIHTIRDPISSFDRYVDHWFQLGLEIHQPTLIVLRHLVSADRPHFGMDSRTRALRFEDLHCNTAETVRDLSDWLGLPYQATSLDSTFNGIPYVVARDGNTWSGPRLEQAQRHSRNVSRKDRALLFALFYENFVAWNYPCPKIFGKPIIRWLVLILFLLPMKAEISEARTVFKREVLPSVRQGNISIAIKSLLGILVCRLRVIWIVARELFRRLTYAKTLLHVDHKRR
ncbi:MAG: sulfotransferase [Methylocella sp.]